MRTTTVLWEMHPFHGVWLVLVLWWSWCVLKNKRLLFTSFYFFLIFWWNALTWVRIELLLYINKKCLFLLFFSLSKGILFDDYTITKCTKRMDPNGEYYCCHHRFYFCHAWFDRMITKNKMEEVIYRLY